MIELILTNTLDSFPILEKLKNSLNQTKRHLLFVPDRFSLSYQKAVLEHLGIKGSFDIEVTSFVRLADKLLENDKKVLDKQSEVMLLRKIIEDNKKQLLCFGRASNSVNFANDMYAAISQIRNSNIPVKRMADAVKDMPERVAHKTEDIVLIYKKYVEYLQSGYTDGTSKLQALSDKIYEGELNDCNIYISDFMSFSGVEYEVLKALMLHSMNTTVCLVDSDGENKHVFPLDVKNRFLSVVDEIGLKADIKYCFQKLEGDALTINRELYGYSSARKTQSTGYTKVFSCKDISQEVKNVARTINRLVKTSDTRYKDIAIVCCDFPSYIPYIKSTFDSFGIPFYADVKQSLSEQAVTKLLSAAIQTAIGDFECGDVITLTKQLLFSTDYGEVCVFENYCLKYGIEYTRFLTPFSIGDEKTRSIAEKIRSKVSRFVESFRNLNGTVSEYVAKVKDFLKNIDAEILVRQLAEKQNANGYEELASVTLQSLQKILLLLDRCENMLGTNAMEFEEFYRIFMTAVESVEMSNVPVFLDCVFIGESSQSRYENIDYMFVLGANAGKFPLEHSDNGIVAEREYVAWSKMGIDVQPDCRRRNAQERLNVLMLLTRAKKNLYISYPSSDTKGAELQPSNTVNYICDILDINAQPVGQPLPEWTINDYAVYVSSQGNVLNELIDMQRTFRQGAVEITDAFLKATDVLYDIATKRYGKEYVDKLLSCEDEETQIDEKGIMFKDNHTSPSQMEKYFDCPFKHFIDYELRLNPREVNELESKDTGTLLHAVLEKYFSLKDCADKSEDEIETLIPQIYLEAVKSHPEFAYLLEDSRQTLMYNQLVGQAVYVVRNLVANMQVTKFRPYKTEVNFGGDGTGGRLKGMEIDNGYRKLPFVGQIDRIDTYKDRMIVVDYKSKYNIKFSISDVLYGNRIQLFIYLNALRRNMDLTPQGVFYLLINNRFLRDGDKTAKRFMHRGFVNSDSDFADLDCNMAMPQNKRYTSSVYPIGCQTTKNEIKYSANKDYGTMVNGKTFDNICDYVIRLTTKAATEIEEGYIAKSPLINDKDDEPKSCAYCKYRSICNRCQIKLRSREEISMQEFNDIFGGEEA